MSMRKIKVAALVAVLLAAALAFAGQGCNKSHQQSQVTIAGKTWNVELAVTTEQRRAGLAGRASLKDGEGMLFIFESSQSREFWMRGCLTAIDIAFLDADRRVINIATMYPQPGVSEGRLKVYRSAGPALYALEVAGGQLASAGVKPGDQAIFSSNVPTLESSTTK